MNYRGDTLEAMAASGVEFFATQCPWLGGRSLVMGQILFHIVTDSTLSNTPYECIEMNNAGGGEEYARKEYKQIESRISVYPNPAADMLHLDMPPGFADVMIYDAQGALKWNERCSGKQISIDIRSLPVGIYFLSIVQNGMVSAHKVNILR